MKNWDKRQNFHLLDNTFKNTSLYSLHESVFSLHKGCVVNKIETRCAMYCGSHSTVILLIKRASLESSVF